MNLQQLQHAIRDKDDIAVHVIRHGGSSLYQVEYQQDDGASRLLERRGKPQLFRSLDAVYDELRHIGVRRAYLIQRDSRDDALVPYAHAQAATLPLVF